MSRGRVSEKSLANLKPFKPGQSGNPGGRSPIIKEIRTLAQSNGKEAFQRVLDLMMSDDERVALTAAQEVLNRAYGKPTQHIEAKTTQVSELPDDELAEILGAVRAIATSISLEDARDGKREAAVRKPAKGVSTLQ